MELAALVCTGSVRGLPKHARIHVQMHKQCIHSYVCTSVKALTSLLHISEGFTTHQLVWLVESSHFADGMKQGESDVRHTSGNFFTAFVSFSHSQRINSEGG